MHRVSNPLRRRALVALRPGVEAMLLAAVALGCAQAGWSIVAPASAGASGPSSDDAERLTQRYEDVAVRAVRSPFAPQASADAGGAAAAFLATVRLSGVRVADDPALSGAYLTLGGAGERAFLVGDDLGEGVRLTEVRADRILVAREGVTSEIPLAQTAAPSRPSYALALMGRLPSPDVAAQPGDAENGAPSPALGAMATPFALTSALGAPEERNGRVVGWRLSSDLPEAARAAGLQAGDVVVAVNGFGADDPAALVRAAQSGGPLTLSVQRGEASLTFSLTNAPRT